MLSFSISSRRNLLNENLRRNMDRTHAEACKADCEEELISSLPLEFHVFLKHLKKLNYNHKPGIASSLSMLFQALLPRPSVDQLDVLNMLMIGSDMWDFQITICYRHSLNKSWKRRVKVCKILTTGNQMENMLRNSIHCMLATFIRHFN